MALSSSTRQEWVVLLEVADEDGEGIDRATFARLADFWTDARANALYSPSRYALQVSVQAPNPAGALSAALLRWKDALRHSGLPEWNLVRAELVTPQELERQIAVVAARILDRVSGTVHGVGGPVSITASLGTEMAPAGADADIVLLYAEHAMRAAVSLRFNLATRCADDVNRAS